MASKLRMFLGSNVFVSRYFGDRFAVILPGVRNISEYEDIAKKIISLVSEPFIIDEHSLNVTISMGISVFPDDGKDSDSLKTNANSALMRAKTEGKSSYKFYCPKMDIQSYKEFILRNDFRKAIEEGEFKVYYQPIVKLKGSEILGAEALIRWEHQAFGALPPSEFISIAEETGFIIDIGNFTLRSVCSTYKKWLSQGFPAIKIAINYSSVHFHQVGFVENIKNIIDEFKLDSNFLIIEIAEKILSGDKDYIMNNIKRLREFGIQVALDDFGTGYSSLEYLNLFNVDILKIDNTFIKNAIVDRTSNIITETLIKMAKELRIKLVAEGIETKEQLVYLQKLNCFSGQGFLYSKPTPVEEFEKILSKKRLKIINIKGSEMEQRRSFFRLRFHNLLEGDMTILSINDKKVNLGYTKVLIEDMGLGGLKFVSNIRLPIKNSIIVQFRTEMLGQEINAYGSPVWAEEMQGDLHEYGIEFTFDENERTLLTEVLNKFQIKMRNNMGFNEGRFVLDFPIKYFEKLADGIG